MSDHDHDHQAADMAGLQAGLEALAGEVRDVTSVLARDFVNGEIGTFVLRGPGPASVTDDQGSNALSYAVYNYNDVAVTIATRAASLIVPPKFLVVAPLTVNGAVELRAELVGEMITVQRWRFPTPQPFFAAKLA